VAQALFLLFFGLPLEAGRADSSTYRRTVRHDIQIVLSPHLMATADARTEDY